MTSAALPKTAALSPSSSQQAVRVSLTVDELTRRQALRVEGDRLRLSQLEPSDAVRGEVAAYEARLAQGQRALNAYRTSEAGSWSYAQGRAVDATREAEALRQRLVGSESEGLKSERREALAALRADDEALRDLQKLRADLGGRPGETLYDAGRAVRERVYNAEADSWRNAAPGAPEYLSLSEPYYTLGARSLSEQAAKQTDRLANIAKTADRLEGAPGAEAALRRSQLILERKWAEQNLAELKRVEAQRGGSSAPVVLGFWVQVPTNGAGSSAPGLLFPSS